MYLSETQLEVPLRIEAEGTLEKLAAAINEQLPGLLPVRVVITESHGNKLRCEVATFQAQSGPASFSCPSPLSFTKRRVENTRCFNAVLLVPTGVGAAIGGHAGDATPVAKMLGAVCDTLITHPNVVNASDINEIPGNAWYVEGSAVSRLLMGSVGLQPVRSNRVLVLIDSHPDEVFVNGAINSVNAARSSYGLECPRIIRLDPPLEMKSSYASSGRATGFVTGMAHMFEALDRYRAEYDAIGISSVIAVPPSYHKSYFDSAGVMINPWGGVEAMLTHTITTLYNVPSAHSPMLESQEIADLDTGVVDPRMAAEAVSLTFLNSILKGLQKSPRIIADPEAMAGHGVFTVSDVACLVIPDGCLGLPVLAALEQGIKVIAVRENQTLMQNDLAALPWSQGQFYRVNNYWEAAGVMMALKAGIDPRSVRRPILPAAVEVTSPRSASASPVS